MHPKSSLLPISDHNIMGAHVGCLKRNHEGGIELRPHMYRRRLTTESDPDLQEEGIIRLQLNH